MQKRFYSTSEVAALLEVNRYTVSLWIDRGTIKAMITPGGHKKIPREEVVRYIQSRGGTLPPELCEVHQIKIAIVDDEPGVLRMYSRYLRMYFPGVEVEEFDHPVSALLSMGKSIPDMVLLDIVMPDMDGISLCRRIREDSSLKSMRIIAMSGSADNARIRQIRDAGADDFFYKTDHVQNLVRMVSNLLMLEPAEQFAASGQ